MGRNGGMEMAKDALNIFIRSLPLGCRFSIIGFGSNYEMLQHDGQNFGILYDERSKESALAQIAEFKANFGKHELFNPFLHAQTWPAGGDSPRRIFLLVGGWFD